MDCKTDLFLTKDKVTGENLFVVKSPLVTLIIKPNYSLKRNLSEYEGYFSTFVCTVEDIYPEDLILYYDADSKEISIYTQITWKLRNLKDENLDAYNEISKAIDDILDYIANKEGYSVVRKSRFITLQKKGIRLLIIDTNTFAYFLPCSLDYRNPVSYEKVLRCISFAYKLKSLQLYDKIIRKAIASIKTLEV